MIGGTLYIVHSNVDGRRYIGIVPSGGGIYIEYMVGSPSTLQKRWLEVLVDYKMDGWRY